MTSPPRRVVLVTVIVLVVAGIVAYAATATGRTEKPFDYVLRAANGPAGKMVVTGNGMTVYVYLPDKTNPSVTTCVGDCANDWPPVLLTSSGVRVSGLAKSRMGLVTRPDGSRQLTLNGYPLYRFAADHRRGELRGEAVGSTWFGIDPTGNFLPLPPTTFNAGSLSTGSGSPEPIRIVADTPVGQVVTAGDGQTLYTYKDDTPNSSACTPAWCVQDWPPLVIARAPGPIDGITAPIGVLLRTDGSLQLTLDGHPLYRFSGDLHPGDLRGSGIGGDWYPLHPDGSKALAAP